MKEDIFKTDEDLSRSIDSFFEDLTDLSRQMQEQIIWRNILYYVGEQYIEYSKTVRGFRRRTVPAFLPTPVSNEIREWVRSVKASLMTSSFVPRIYPNTNEKEDVEAAELGESLLIWMDQSNDQEYFDEKEKLCIWIALAGTAFMRTYPDVDRGKWFFVDNERLTTGDVACETIMPFNVRLDPLGDNLEKKRWVGIQSLKDREWVEDTFKQKIAPGSQNKALIDYQKKLMKLVSEVSPWKGHAFEVQTLDPDWDDLVLFREVEFKPCKQHPKGLYAVQCGKKIIYKKKRLLITDKQDNWSYSLTDFHYNYVPGRFWSDSCLNDLISSQDIINQIDQALAINRRGLGRPRILSPGDVGLKKLELQGHGFLAISYNPIMGLKPEIDRGIPLPEQVLAERKIQKEQIQDSGGDPKNILRGQPPSAQSSGIQVDILRETAEKGRQPDLDRFKRSENKVYRKRLLVAQEIFTEERLVKITGRDKKPKVMKFKSADLRGNTDVRLELDSGLIMTKSGQAQVILNMIQAGALGDLANNPTLRQETFQRLGMSSFTDEVDVDVERAETENAKLRSGDTSVMQTSVQKNPQTGEERETVIFLDPVFKYDNHIAHIEAHRKLLVSSEFMEWPQQIALVLLNHTDTHQKALEMRTPDIREFVDISKLYPMLTREEQMQILEKMGVKADDSAGVAGLPDAGTYAKVVAHTADSASRAKAKDDDRVAKIITTMIDAKEEKRVAKP